MTDSKLSELLEHAGERVDVGPPPLDALRAGARRRRRRRTVALSVTSALAVIAAIGGTTLLTRPGPTGPSVAVSSPTPATAPAGTRLVGLGHAAIAVPKDWGTDQLTCTTPKRDTVIVDVGFMTLCMAPWPVGVDSVKLGSGKPPFDFKADEAVQVAGVPAQRQRTTCSERGTYSVQVCSSTILIPSLGVWFQVDSATSAAEVDRILRWIMIVPDRVGVPGYRTVDRSGHQPLGAAYADMLKQAGLTPKIRTTKSPGYPAGTILTASPGPGTMLSPSSTVTITVVG